jgi:glycosyltransferase involved in cell wall biosynthesis/2-polyprenyl-3-methyl-5-hydroxy-6-metoxy-1,4-benzoquinol methylase
MRLWRQAYGRAPAPGSPSRMLYTNRRRGRMIPPMAWKTGYARDELEDVACPGCGERRPHDLAEEFGIVVARCRACDLVYTRTPLPASQAHYSSVSREAMLTKYAAVFSGESAHGRDPTYEEHLDLLETLGPRGDLLDVGSHCGFFLRKARSRGWRVQGVEPSPTTAALAREQFGLDVRNGTLEQAGFPDASFDVVTLVDVFEHVPRPGNLLREVRRVLRPGGRVFVKVPNVRYVLLKHRTLRRIPGLLEDVFDAREHLVYYSDRTLCSMLETCGFQVEVVGVPAPIQTGGPLRRAVRAAGPALARRLPRGTALPIATDVVAVARVRSRPKVLFVGSTAYDLPLPSGLARKWDAVSERLDVRVVARAGRIDSPDPRFRLLPAPFGRLHGPTFFASLPAVVTQEIWRFRPDLVIAESPYEAMAALPGRRLHPRPKLLVELHGDPTAATRFYGSRGRRLYAGLADRVALAGLRRADATRAVSSSTAAIARRATGREPVAVFPTYFDLESFQSEQSPLPRRPRASFVGALQRYKNPTALAGAWRLVASRLPEACLVVVGDGPQRPVVDALVAEFPLNVEAIPRLSPSGVARVLDQSTLLVLSSESEGLPRVVLEAFARGRPVVSFDVGGIADAVKSGRNGLLVPPGDIRALADALTRVLSDRGFTERLGRAASEDAELFRWTPERYAQSLREAVDRVLGGG